MFKLCHIKEHPDVKFILYDNSDFTVDELGLESESELILKDMKFDNDVANHYPLISYSDLLIRTIKPKYRTESDILHAIGVLNLSDLDCENTLIQLKRSKLSKSQRDLVQKRYQEIYKMGE